MLVNSFVDLGWGWGVAGINQCCTIKSITHLTHNKIAQKYKCWPALGAELGMPDAPWF